MNASTPPDPLVSLWQNTPKPDTGSLLFALDRQRQLHRRLNRTLWALLCGVGILIAFEEATGRVNTNGVLSGMWLLGLGIGFVLMRRSQVNRSQVLTMDMAGLLKSTIARAKKDLFLARCLYAGVPCGAVASYIILKLAGFGSSPSANAAGPRLSAIQTAAGIVALLIMIIAGVILARSRRLQVQDLTKKLTSIAEDV